MGGRRGSGRGFTLIELLVVIVILAILMGIAIPAYLSQQKKARDSAVKQYLATSLRSARAELVGNGGSVGYPTAASLSGLLAADQPQITYKVGGASSATSAGTIVIDSASGGQTLILYGKSGSGDIWKLTASPTSTSDSASFSDLGTVISPIALAMGDVANCIILSDKTLQCWGPNSDGEVGDGTTTERDSPVTVPLSNVIAATASSRATCAIVIGGSVYCWGRNTEGEIGDGTSVDQHSPELISGVSNATQISASDGQTCALISGGTMKCWGWNYSGQLGDGTTTQRLTPVTVSGLGGTVTQIGTEASSTCALLSNGQIQCWGYYADGNLGNGAAAGGAQSTPVYVSGISTATALSAGWDGACALLSDKTVKCWGSDGYGEAGDGGGSYKSTPVTVSGITNAVGIADGNYFACALLSDGTVKCWGYGLHGELGNGGTSNSTTPVTVSGITNAVEISTHNGNITCARLSSGGVKCWGWNMNGRLGDGVSSGGGTTPVSVTGF